MAFRLNFKPPNRPLSSSASSSSSSLRLSVLRSRSWQQQQQYQRRLNFSSIRCCNGQIVTRGGSPPPLVASSSSLPSLPLSSSSSSQRTLLSFSFSCSFSTTSRTLGRQQQQPSNNDNGNVKVKVNVNVGNIGLVPEPDAVVGKQAPEEPLTIEGIEARRRKAGTLVAPAASYSDSDMFKSPQAFDQPKARRWDHLLSQESLAREPCVLKAAAKHLKKPGLISLGGGLPSPENFPIDSLSLRVPTPPRFVSEAEAEIETADPSPLGGGRDLKIGKYDVSRNEHAEYDLSIALNYGQSVGSAQLLRWVTEHTELVSRPPYADWRCSLTIGSTGALEQSIRMFCDRNRRDSILTEEYSFSTALETAAPLGIHVFGVRMDEQGMLPESLDEILSTWDESARGGARKPTVLYTVPSGQNPTGATMREQRRRDVYEVCRRHDLFIFEDEPYYYLQLPEYDADMGRDEGPGVLPERTTATGKEEEAETAESFLKSLIPSLLSLDVDGRVLRMDSFSKVVVPGSRVGWITASEQVVERYIRHAECASQGPSGISQILLHKLVDEHWGHRGYLEWLMSRRDQYTRRRNAMLDACEKYLRPLGVVSWVPPRAGMFVRLFISFFFSPSPFRV
ncbi:PLP-dependent transferase [Xylariomycetidae sp. FL2044]|nr:PLP-dependent transferase [Xylariomycetidae sp. FL2044]